MLRPRAPPEEVEESFRFATPLRIAIAAFWPSTGCLPGQHYLPTQPTVYLPNRLSTYPTDRFLPNRLFTYPTDCVPNQPTVCLRPTGYLVTE